MARRKSKYPERPHKMSEEVKNRFLALMRKEEIEERPPTRKKKSDLWRWDTLEDVQFDR